MAFTDVDKTLYYQAAIHKLEAPEYFDLKDTQKFLVGDEMGFSLTGPDLKAWGDCSDHMSYADDGLVALCHV
jgi:hypothetical protein